MLQMTTHNVRLGAAATTAEEAIRAAGDLLVAGEAIEPEYIESMLARERTATTYLGNGLAIPHGRPEDTGRIKHTQIAILQIPDGVRWKNGKTVRLLFAIAAKSDEHIELLRRLTAIVCDQELANRLASTDDVSEILKAVETTEAAAAIGQEAATDFDGSEFHLDFMNPRGFHLRPAGRFARTVKSYAGSVTLVVRGREIVPDSPTRILNSGISNGDRISLRVKGEDETDTLSSLAALLLEVNNEPQEETESVSAIGVQWEALEETAIQIKGTLAAPGLAVAPLFHWTPSRLDDTKRPVGDVDSELADLSNAVTTAISDLAALCEAPLNPVQRDLFEAHSALLEDDELLRETNTLIRGGKDALTAWRETIEAKAAKTEALGDANLVQRAIDLRDIGTRVQNILLGTSTDILAGVDAPAILIADDLQPSDAAQLDTDRIVGICLKKGSPNAHAAIVSRSLGIPMVVAMGDELDQVEAAPCKTVILDASGARLIVNPTEADIDSAREAIDELSAMRDRDLDHRFEPAILKDGHRVEVVANIGRICDAEQVISSGAEGVGLLRTEFLFLDRTAAPNETEQYRALKCMIESLQGLPMIVRTMDIGGDKPVDYLGLSEQDLSFLGLRGSRLAMARPDLARTQLRAIYRAAEHGPVRIMFPMIATINDFFRARELAEKVRREVNGPKIEMGIMVEVPSAVALAPELAEHVDFFSIGTNDLTQYTLAMDRTHPMLAKRADSLHPAVLRLIEMTVKAAHGKGKWVGVCGGLAADPLGALILTGLGIDELSMPSSTVAGIKALLRRENLASLTALAHQALQQRDARAVRALHPMN